MMRAISEVGYGPGTDAAVLDIRPYRLRSIIRQREARARHFSSALFADPAWDMLLDLALARFSDEPLNLRANRTMSAMTVDRWLGLLEDEELASRDGGDWRLSERGVQAVSDWLSDQRA